MKIKLMRQSLNPVEKSELDKMMNEYRLCFDSIMKEHGQDMKLVHEKVEELVSNLADKYKDKREIEVEFPKSQKAWIELLSSYGMISVGTHIDSGKLCFIVMDADDSGLDLQ